MLSHESTQKLSDPTSTSTLSHRSRTTTHSACISAKSQHSSQKVLHRASSAVFPRATLRRRRHAEKLLDSSSIVTKPIRQSNIIDDCIAWDKAIRCSGVTQKW